MAAGLHFLIIKEWRIPFDGDLEVFRGKEVTLEFTMSDADLYSMIFE